MLEGLPPEQALDAVGADALCCRRMLLCERRYVSWRVLQRRRR
jgi:DNA-directed RNA polymerase subunit N (RpoN/RPB10)